MVSRNQVGMAARSSSSNSSPVVLDDIPFEPNVHKLMQRLRIKDGTRYLDRLMGLLEEAHTIARPRAMYVPVYIDSRDEESVVIGDVALRSRILRVNLEGVHRVFPFAVTAGNELHQWMRAQDDLLLRYYAEVIGETALRTASSTAKRHVTEQHGLGSSSTMSPGSLNDWPIEEQRPLFSLLGNPEEAIGLRLTDGLMMIPSQSVSGIRFPTETTFESCQLCRRERCPSRRAPYDEGLYERRYSGASLGTSVS